ncbi:MAG TPA: redoxin family protein [Saprospiraceae bacterium]|nr:redoxin family protein [Saprospiraceae bacterium]HMQ84802.1 redoxin family protein [Saprospiraceae bacterium]
MKASTLFLFACLAFVAQAQPPAPDFTVTSSDGQTHHLYADYLNQGKTVVVKLFFTYCPPCNATAEQVEAFYQSWGGGEGMVEFIGLSTQNNDSNADVNQYKALHGQTFPGVGADGGSISAIQPYINGTYGLFLGTPTFIVIAPDGTVAYDPRGSNFDATLAELNDAIIATGLAPYTDINGNGTVKTKTGLGLPDVDVVIAAQTPLQSTSNASGSFSFNLFAPADAQFSITASSQDNDYLNGLSTADLLLIHAHVLGIMPLGTPEKRIAADADGNGIITTLDIISLRKLLLSIDTQLGNQDAWIFINTDYDFANQTNPLNEVYSGAATTINYTAGQASPARFTAIKIGDVNDSVVVN